MAFSKNAFFRQQSEYKNLTKVDKAYINSVIDFWNKENFTLKNKTPMQLWHEVVDKMHSSGVSIHYNSDILCNLFNAYFNVSIE